ncbi:MAG TPA: SHOCT domain-containing protein [Ktedonobacterales bacterium]
MMRRRALGRPVLRTAVVGGAAYMAGSSAARKQQAEAEQNAQIADLQQQQAAMQTGAQYQAQPTYAPPSYAQPAYAPPPAPEPVAAPAPTQDPIAMLKQLGELKAAGVLTDEEFEAKKAQLLKQI